ncbi:MAG: efflux RND transporter periplasmic adaptor subunit [Chitinophagales bacterium]|nr:efflux RND transporter periplasmic adaptor subunit [Chitinophagales bacterium]
MKSNKILYILAAATVLIVILAIVAKKSGFGGDRNSTKVSVKEAQKRSIVETVTATGKIYPEVEVKISADVSGEVIELLIDEGDSVLKGELLLKINPDIYESIVNRANATLNQGRANEASSKATLTQMEAQFRQSKSEYERNKKLYSENVLSSAEFERAEAAYETAVSNLESSKQNVKAAQFSVQSAAATLKEARENYRKTEIYAPVNGIVSKLNVEQGERVVGTAQMQGTEILRIADLNNMEVHVNVSENDVLRVSIGDTTKVEVDAYLNETFLGIVTQIAHSPDREITITSDQVTNFTVDIRLLRASYKELIQPDKGHKYPFRPGMTATVDIETEKRTGIITVPIQSVTTREASELESEEDIDENEILEMVFTVDDGKAKLLQVETGIQDDEFIEIMSGVDEGMNIITAPFREISKGLDNGDKVKVVEEKELFKK